MCRLELLSLPFVLKPIMLDRLSTSWKSMAGEFSCCWPSRCDVKDRSYASARTCTKRVHDPLSTVSNTKHNAGALSKVRNYWWAEFAAACTLCYYFRKYG